MATAIFYGDKTLIIQCAEYFLESGGSILGIVTSDKLITEWAKRNGVVCWEASDSLPGELLSVDYVFSIANHDELPEAIISLDPEAQINFHDGPLPSYCGFNVPTWAMIDGQSDHAVTWHGVVRGSDNDMTFVERKIDIDQDDTSFDLNAKCYAAGVEGFRALIDAIFGSGLTGRARQGERVWFANFKRPEGLGILDFSKSSRETIRLVRALNFGPGKNPLGFAKLWTGSGVWKVVSAKLVPGSGAPGSVLSWEGYDVDVATLDGAVRLACEEMISTESSKSLEVKEFIPVVDSLDVVTLDQIGKAECYWTNCSKSLVAAMPAHPKTGRNTHGGPGQTNDQIKSQTQSQPTVHKLDIEHADIVSLAAAWITWCAKQNGSDKGAISITSPTNHPGISDRLILEASMGNTSGETIASTASALQFARTRGPLPIDFAHRLDDEQRIVFHQINHIVFAKTIADIKQPYEIAITMDGQFLCCPKAYDVATATTMAGQFSRYAQSFLNGNPKLTELTLTDPSQPSLVSMGDEFDRFATIHGMFEAQVSATPNHIALEAGDVALTYDQLSDRAESLARALVERGAKIGSVVGVCHRRNAELIISLLAVLKTGAAYLPLDPTYPKDRIDYMIKDSGAELIVCDSRSATALNIDKQKQVLSSARSDEGFDTDVSATNLAYQIYTSGSTGKPKGVMVTHRNVVNFFKGMDSKIPFSRSARLLAVTSISFDISVLDIFWTLSRGATVVLQVDDEEEKSPGFSLFYFASQSTGADHDAYRLLIEGAKFADENGFEAIWNPERHFHEFGGLYPNPVVSLAAVAGMTKNVKLRGGSCVIPLHHPVRAAEDWALLDNLSNGRAGLAAASGWQPNDFILQPQNFRDRKNVTMESIETMRSLWRGEQRTFSGHDGSPVDLKISVRPVNGDIPIWITAAGNPETFAIAAKAGFGVLTHLLGQTFDELEEKITAYHRGWKEAGHEGEGVVTLMLHTFVGESDDAVREIVREPMKQYLKSATDLIRRASWSSPAFKKTGSAASKTTENVFEEKNLTPEELDALLEHSFERYYEMSGLFGTVEHAQKILRKAINIGVGEIACLIDFGVDTDLVLDSLKYIKYLMNETASKGSAKHSFSVPESIKKHRITHLQCTPGMAALIASDGAGRAALGELDVMMVGGEAMQPGLARDLLGSLKGNLFNMYGPTETTIWSSVAKVNDDVVTLGQPIANTMLSVRSRTGEAMPQLVPGELWIGGEGVTNGYWRRPDLTADCFVTTPQGMFYRTGDWVRVNLNGDLEFLGRKDNQVKVSGYRIELGEIESALCEDKMICAAVVVALDAPQGNKRLVGYVTLQPGANFDEAQIKNNLAGRLPEFMIPLRIVALNAFPQTPNGKVDRRGLPSPYEQVADGEADRGAISVTEKKVAEVWKSVLGLNSISTTANFFELGGHSLLVVQVQRQLKETLGRDIAITDVFRFSTIQSFSRHIDHKMEHALAARGRGTSRAEARLARRGTRIVNNNQ